MFHKQHKTVYKISKAAAAILQLWLRLEPDTYGFQRSDSLDVIWNAYGKEI